MMAMGPFPKGIDEKWDLKMPLLWDVDYFTKHRRMAVARGNDKFERIYKTTQTDVPKLIAWVRWLILQMPYGKFSRASHITQNGYKAMEKDRGPKNRPHRSKVTRLLAFWEKKGISTGIREQLLDLLTAPELLEAAPASTDLLSAIKEVRNDVKNILGPDQVADFYQRIGYECGHDRVEKHFPRIYNTVWQRKRSRTIPDYLEVMQLVDVLYAGRSKEMQEKRNFRHAQGEALWSGAKQNYYRECTLEKPLADLLIVMERHLAWGHATTLTTESMVEHLTFNPAAAARLTQRELIEPNDVPLIVQKLFQGKSRTEFMSQWKQAYEDEQKRPTFGKLTSSAMAERGYTAADIANLLGIRSPEERGKDPQKKRLQRFRPDGEVRGVLFDNDVSKQIPVEAIVQLLSRDENEATVLRNAYISERARYYRRTGSWLEGDGFKMRMLRELANVDTKDLACHFLPSKQHGNKKIVHEKSMELQRLERNEGKQHVIPFKTVHAILEKIATERGEEALARVPKLNEISESLQEFSTVPEMAMNLMKAMKGANQVSEAMRDIAKDSSLWLTAPLIRDVSQGTYVCPLPSLRVMLKATLNRTLPEDIERDWHERFPKQLKRGVAEFSRCTRPLARVLTTLIATKEADPIRFFKDRVPGVVPTHGTKYLRDIEAGTPVEWKHIHKILLAVGLKSFDVPYQLAKGLYETTGDVNSVLKSLVPVLRKAEKDVHPMQLPGLTSAELQSYKRKK